jgi:hypothetical protein
MKPEYIGVGNFDEDNYVYAFCKCPLPVDYAINYGPEVYEEKSKDCIKGTWILTQRGEYIDINCSECGYTRMKEYAYNYTIDEIDIQEVKDLVVTSKMNYCECCGAKMQGVKK